MGHSGIVLGVVVVDVVVGIIVVVCSSSASALDGLIVVSMVVAWDTMSDFVAMERKLDRSNCSSLCYLECTLLFLCV